MTSTERAWQRARRARDARFDGRFFVAVVTTGIYCRPVCPAPAPLERHVRYFATAAAAADAGFRPCLRCHPEIAPGSPAWLGTPATVQRALRLIDEHGLDELGIDALASRLGIGPRHLHRLFVEHLGAPPHTVLHTRRLHFAKQLVDQTTLPFSTVALASGFGSIRRFNAAVRQAWQRTPRDLRRGASDREGTSAAAYSLRLGYRPPYDWPAMLSFLGRRALPGLERVTGDSYARAFEIDGVPGAFEVRPDPHANACALSIRCADPRVLYRVVARVRDLLDLDADPIAIAQALGSDPLLAATVTARPGLRVPGCWDGFEIAVRAIVGQQTSVSGARTLLTRLVERYGEPVTIGDEAWLLFPRPSTLTAAGAAAIGLTRARAESLAALADASAAGRLTLTRDADVSSTRNRLRALPGIGSWTTEYVAMRALRDPDAFPAGDLVLRRRSGLGERSLGQRADAWRPWRAYAVMHLWMGDTNDQSPQPHDRREPRRAAAACGRRRGPARPPFRRRPPAH